jgi:hypothetical protein
VVVVEVMGIKRQVELEERVVVEMGEYESGSTLGTNGTTNTGGGGGGNFISGGQQMVAAGGSGVVIIKIPDTRTATFSGGVTSSLSTAVSGFKIYTVTATSTTSETVTFS